MSNITKVTVVKKNTYPRNQEIISFFENKGLYGKTDEFSQFSKLEEETEELYEELRHGPKENILSEAGDVYITLLNVLHCCGLSIEDAVNTAADKVVKRKGKVINGVFVKEES